MRQIGTIENELDAQRFGAYLLTINIGNTVEESSDRWAVWVENDDHLERAAGELEKFHADPRSPSYADAAAEAKRVRASEVKAADRRRRNFIDVRTHGQKAAQSAAPFTLFLAGACVLIGLLTRVWGGGHEEPPLVNKLRIAPVSVVVGSEGYPVLLHDHLAAIFKRGEVWRLVTPIFMHGGLLHLIFNVYWLVSFGALIETRRGTLFFEILVLVTAVVSNLAQYYWSGPFFLGMSGVNYGLFGYLWIKGRYDPESGLGVSQQTVSIMLVWLVACMTGMLGPIANMCHVAGLAVGASFAYAPHAWKLHRPRGG